MSFRRKHNPNSEYMARKLSVPVSSMEVEAAVAECDGATVIGKKSTGPKADHGKSEEKPQVRDIFLKTDIHGLPEFYESRTWKVKCCWLIILIVAIFFLSFQIYELFLEYRDNPILTTYSIIAEEDGLHLPTVYICPLSPIHQGQRKKVNVPKSWEDEKNVSQLFQSSGLSDSGGDPNSILSQKKKVWDEIEVEAEEAGRGVSECWQLLDGTTTTERPEYIPRDIEDYFMHVGYPIKTLFQECAFATEPLNCSDIVEEVFDRDYGKCFLVNSNSMLQRLPGIGLSLVLNLDTRHAFSSSPPLFDGLVLKLEEKFDLASYHKILLHPSRYTIVNLSAKKYSLIEQVRPVGGSQQCQDSDNAEEDLKTIKSNYSLGVCRMDCTQTAVLVGCGCVLPMSRRHINPELFGKNPDFDEDPYCSYSMLKSCAFPLIMHKLREDKEFKACYKKCKVPCEYWEFGAEVTSARFPSDMFLNPSATGQSAKRKKREANMKNKKKAKNIRSKAAGLMFCHSSVFSFLENNGTFILEASNGNEKNSDLMNRKKGKRRHKREEESGTAAQPETTVSTTSGSQSVFKTTDTHYYYEGYDDVMTTSASSLESNSRSTTAGQSSIASPSGSTASQSMVPTTTEQTEDEYAPYEYDEEEGSSKEKEELEEAKRRALYEKCFGEDPFSTQDWLDYIVVDIAYSNLQFTHISQENAISFTQAVSDVGGSLGLWLGCSMISIIKIFLVTAPVFWFGLKQKQKRRQQLGIVVNDQIIRERMKNLASDQEAVRQRMMDIANTSYM